jgi:hypothetical protein
MIILEAFWIIWHTLKPRILKIKFKRKIMPPSSYTDYQRCDAINLCNLFKRSNILILRICSTVNVLWMQVKHLCYFLSNREKKICRWIERQWTRSMELACFVSTWSHFSSCVPYTRSYSSSSVPSNLNTGSLVCLAEQVTAQGNIKLNTFRLIFHNKGSLLQ